MIIAIKNWVTFNKMALITYAYCTLQVWKGQGSRKWKHGQSDGFFVQFESHSLQKLWFIPSSTEKGQSLCRSVYLPLSVCLCALWLCSMTG